MSVVRSFNGITYSSATSVSPTPPKSHKAYPGCFAASLFSISPMTFSRPTKVWLRTKRMTYLASVSDGWSESPTSWSLSRRIFYNWIKIASVLLSSRAFVLTCNCRVNIFRSLSSEYWSASIFSAPRSILKAFHPFSTRFRLLWNHCRPFGPRSTVLAVNLTSSKTAINFLFLCRTLVDCCPVGE